MANCCYTEIDIFSETHQDKLALLDENINKWTEGDWGENWLGNILINSGVTDKKTIEDGNSPYRCRGSIVYNEMYGPEQLHITTETAWVPMMAMWPAVCEKIGIDDAEIVFSAEEPGCEVFVTNDEDLLNEPYVFEGNFEGEDKYMGRFFGLDEDIYDGYIDEHEVSEERIKNVLGNAKKEIPDLKCLDELYKYLKNDNSYFNIHRFDKGGLEDY